MNKIFYGDTQPNPKESKIWLDSKGQLKTYNNNKRQWGSLISSSGKPEELPDEPEEPTVPDTPVVPEEPTIIYEFVDLGLKSGLKWAAWNVGATKPEEYGLYFAWGETQGYTAKDVENGIKQFSWSDYKHCNGSYSTLTKYNFIESYGVVDNDKYLDAIDDAAYASDDFYQIPSGYNWEELFENTVHTQETLNGVNGVRFTSKTNGNSIFIPQPNHYCSDGSIIEINNSVLWCNTVDTSMCNYALLAVIDNTPDTGLSVNVSRECGVNIRAVTRKY